MLPTSVSSFAPITIAYRENVVCGFAYAVRSSLSKQTACWSKTKTQMLSSQRLINGQYMVMVRIFAKYCLFPFGIIIASLHSQIIDCLGSDVDDIYSLYFMLLFSCVGMNIRGSD